MSSFFANWHFKWPQFWEKYEKNTFLLIYNVCSQQSSYLVACHHMWQFTLCPSSLVCCILLQWNSLVVLADGWFKDFLKCFRFLIFYHPIHSSRCLFIISVCVCQWRHCLFLNVSLLSDVDFQLALSSLPRLICLCVRFCFCMDTNFNVYSDCFFFDGTSQQTNSDVVLRQ